MSGTILYLAIVAIWAGVLVPRWLRHEPHREPRARRADMPDPSPQPVASAAHQESATPRASAYPPARADPHGRDGVTAEPPNVGSGARMRRRGASARPGANGRRPRSVIAARRRLLGMLVILVAAAATVTITGLAAWWVALPPVGMLGGYVMLLREVARADAELRQARATATRAGRARPRAERHSTMHTAIGGATTAAARNTGVTAATDAAAATPPHADRSGAARIVNITERLGDDIYDQYTDAKLRAVGD